MEIVTERALMMAIARECRSASRTIGFVPTMGALHEGHLSLVRGARAKCDIVIVSIFINPTQFGPKEDFAKYPRDLNQDAALLESEGADYIFAPTLEEIYPPNFSTYVTVEGLSEALEGASRPGHFRGVATVVTILLNIVGPNFAFFGQKDAQQAAVIRRIVRDLAIDTEVVVMPIVREASGLAMSSRNAFLTAEQRRAANALSQALRAAQTEFENGERDAERLIAAARSVLQKEELVRPDYVSINDAETLEKLNRIESRPALISLAAYVGDTRLIDNVVLQSQPEAAAAKS
jgi:pantoate--beta-alanine ligase